MQHIYANATPTAKQPTRLPCRISERFHFKMSLYIVNVALVDVWMLRIFELAFWNTSFIMTLNAKLYNLIRSHQNIDLIYTGIWEWEEKLVVVIQKI